MDLGYEKELNFDINLEEENYYQILNVPYNATKIQIREAYLKLKKTLLPNNNAHYSVMDPVMLERQKELIEEAFLTLSNDLQRRLYDQKLGIISQDREYNKDTHSSLNTELRGGNNLNKDNVSGLESLKPTRIVNVRAFCAKDSNVQEKIKKLIEEWNDSENNHNILRSIRELANLSQEEISERTKLPIHYIRALESYSFDILPKHVIFIRGYVESYLKYIGIKNYTKVIEIYVNRFNKWMKEQRKF